MSTTMTYNNKNAIRFKNLKYTVDGGVLKKSWFKNIFKYFKNNKFTQKQLK
jgi:hypothetical protein